jgi:hypothetical protein
MTKRTILTLELVLIAAAVATALALTVVSPHSSQAPLSFTPSIVGAPPPGSLVLGREAGDLAVGLAVQPQRSATTLVGTVLGPDGSGLSGLDVTFALTTASGRQVGGRGRDCGPGCYETTLTGISGRPIAVSVDLTGQDRAATATFALPKNWPAPPADKLVRQASDVYRRLRTLVIHERLASDPTHVVSTVYRAVAPDRLQLRSDNGTEAVIVGDRRWDKQRGRPWRESSQSPIRSITPYWLTTPVNPHVLGSDSLRGRPAWIVSFATPAVPAWFTIWIDKQTHRTLELRMTAAAHFMRHRYGPFDGRLSVEPPSR